MAGILSALAGSAIGSAGGTAASGALGPLGDLIGYGSRWAVPVTIPSPGELLAALNRQTMGPVLTKAILRMHGISWSAVDPYGDVGGPARAWEAVRQAMRPVPSVDVVLDAWRRGLISDKAWEYWAGRAGADETQWRWLIPLMASRPEPATLAGLRLRGYLDQPQYLSAMKRSGADPKEWETYLRGLRPVPSVAEANALFGRGHIDRDRWKKMLAAVGALPEDWDSTLPGTDSWPSPMDVEIAVMRGLLGDVDANPYRWHAGSTAREIQDFWKGMLRYIPPPSDLIRFAVRDALDREDAVANQTFFEFPEDLRPWFRKQGMDYPLGIQMPADGGERDVSWADVYWSAHWQELSPTQVYRFEHLFRPDRVDRYVKRGYRIKAWGRDDTRRALKLADYPAPAREYLAAAAYNPLRLVDIRSAFMRRLEGDQFVIDQMLDRGHHPDDVAAILRLWTALRAEADAKPARQEAERAAKQAIRYLTAQYRDGFLARVEAEPLLRGYGLGDSEIATILDAQDVAFDRSTVSALMRSLRSDYLRGGMDDAELIAALRGTGLSEGRLEQYLRLWSAQKSHGRKLAATGDVKRWYQDGLIQHDEALRRLTRIGWNRPEALLHLDSTRRQIEERESRILSAQEAGRRREAKELEALAKAAERQTAALRARIKAITPVATLQRWYATGLVTAEYVRARLRGAGYPEDVIELYLRQADEMRRKIDAERQPIEPAEAPLPPPEAPR